MNYICGHYTTFLCQELTIVLKNLSGVGIIILFAQQDTNHLSNYSLLDVFLQNSHIPALDFFNTVDERYGIDLDGPVVLSDGISIPRSNLNFSAADMALLEQHIDPQGVTEYEIDLYEQTLQYISHLTPI